MLIQQKVVDIRKKFNNKNINRIYIVLNAERLQTDGKINLYSHCIDCSFKKFETIDKEELCDLWKSLTVNKTMLLYCPKCRK